MAALVAAIFVLATLMPAMAQSAKRSGVGPCRQGALSLISLLDSKEDNTPDYVTVAVRRVSRASPHFSNWRSALV